MNPEKEKEECRMKRPSDGARGPFLLPSTLVLGAVGGLILGLQAHSGMNSAKRIGIVQPRALLTAVSSECCLYLHMNA